MNSYTDKELLDWLEAHRKEELAVLTIEGFKWMTRWAIAADKGLTLRDAISAAIERGWG